MGTWIVTLNDVSALWGTACWRMCWQGGLALLIVFAICRLFPKIPARFQCWLWRLAYLKLLLTLLWSGTIPLPILPQRTPLPLPVINAPVFTATHVPTISTPTLPPALVTPFAEHASLPAPASAVQPQFPHITPLSAVMLLWLIGMLWGGYRLLLAWRHVRRLRHAAQPIADENAQQALVDICAAFRLHRMPALLAGPVETPVLLGGWRPCILLPHEQITEDASSLRMMLAHEGGAHHAARSAVGMAGHGGRGDRFLPPRGLAGTARSAAGTGDGLRRTGGARVIVSAQ